MTAHGGHAGASNASVAGTTWRRRTVTTTDLSVDAGRRPRVALVAHDVHDEGGMERACAELLRREHKDFAFTVVASELAPDLRPLVERWVRIPVPKRPFPLKFIVFSVLAGIALRRLQVDLVHTVGAIVPNRVDVASIHFCHAGYRKTVGRLAPEATPPLRRLNTAVSRVLALAAEGWCYRPSRLRAFAAVSDGVAAEVHSHYPWIPVSITPNGVDTERFRPDPRSREATRTELGVPTNRCVALFVGGDWDRKGLGVAVEAVAMARAEGVDVVLWVVGRGNEERFRSVAADLGVADAVSFFGRRIDDTETFYQAADLFVLPSAYETFSLVCFEAAACGLPLVIPRVHGAGELVGEGEAGILVEREACSVASALVALARDATLRRALGTEAHRRASAFRWDASCESTAGLYRSLLKEEPR